MTRRLKFFLLIVLLIFPAFRVAYAQTSTYTPGQFQSANPHYPMPNPFFFEGKIDWAKLNISTPSNAWEFAQRGIHFQDDLGDTASAIRDYQTSLSTNSLQNATCQIVTKATLVNGALPSPLSPMPCMFTVRLRLGVLLQNTNPVQAIALFKEVTQIDPLKLDVNAMIGETYVIMAGQTTDPVAQNAAYQNAVQAFQAELALSPVTPQFTAMTADTANNAHVHWSLAEVYDKLGAIASEISELQLYLQATQWHSDVYPWRIPLAQKRIQTLQKAPALASK